MSSPTTIAIIGAGPAGLTLARLLYILCPNSITLTVFERDASPHSRPDIGGTLDLHIDSGLAALKECHLWDAFLRYARYDGQEFVFADKNATELVHVRGGKPKQSVFDRPEIDRYRLKQILLESVPADCIKWGYNLREVTEGGLLRFEGRELGGPFDLVVGADGAWSKVRSRLTDAKPHYAGVSGFEMHMPNPPPHVNNLAGQGSYMGSSDRKMMDVQKIGDGSLKVRCLLVCDEGEANEMLEKYGKQGMREKILEMFADWAPKMIEFFKQASVESLKPWPFYELPVGCKWDHQEGFTLIGDAASLATPFSGEGVNKAMKDSLELAGLIANASKFDQAVIDYERLMFPRAEKMQAATMRNKVNMVGPDAPIGVLTGMLKAAADDSKSMFGKLLGLAPVVAVLYAYFWVRQQFGWAARWYSPTRMAKACRA